MAEKIVCPHCGKEFELTDRGYSDILEQVKNHEFQEALQREKKNMELQKENEISELKRKSAEQLQQSILEAEKKISDLQGKINNFDVEKEASLLKQAQELQKKNNELLNKCKDLQAQIEVEKEKAKTAQIEQSQNKDEEIYKLKVDLEKNKKEGLDKEQALKNQYEVLLKAKQEEVDYYKDLKSKLSTKMIGETLEQHCQNQFNSIRATAFPNAYFEKDNDAKSGSKGDYIYRETDEFGMEILSIMFEMKNENDTTATKHKNEDFFKELDKDRNEKKCEYAVLVSLLEADSDLYNAGIVDVSYRYPKMYVVRPQCFITIIAILRQAAFNAYEARKELALVRAENIDITNFEANMEDFKKKFATGYKKALDSHQKAIEEINKTITHLLKVRDNLMGSDKNLTNANEEAQKLTIKSLTDKSPMLRAKFEALKNEEDE